MSRESVTCVAAMPCALQLLRQFFLRGDALAADQLQDLSLPVALGHTIISRQPLLGGCQCARPRPAARCRPAIRATSCPSCGSSSAAISPVNSGANCAHLFGRPIRRLLAGAHAFQHEASHNLMRLVERRAGARQRFRQIGRHHPAFFRRRRRASPDSASPIRSPRDAISSEPAN